MKLEINSLENINKAAQEFFNCIGEHRVFAFYGPMGVGKTTFIKALCQIFGVKDDISSPTFAIVNEYRGIKGEQLFHFDFYRIKDEEEAFDFGYEDYFYSGAFCFIEWPEKVESLLPSDCVKVDLYETDNAKRILTF
ncbi:MAG: tRNA (adenosine(37)-N6)-threonylcarbamoyltransferase complex ATPase subunit type 1 TsaE [Paludibacteraceae bacterium]|nr:tRNA (adenosine(37)-N6)-threonylcarbamoyltransferase complex ATPase subunit type 1 TsaE [Paludibacteraceae bacterium]MBN2788309.1 tRNA (adenosine(37)-N6)-threonylcarbamoyltransferase complex ATPase subunit type 1 TsaE [Paludibacteraceae bacterium]